MDVLTILLIILLLGVVIAGFSIIFVIFRGVSKRLSSVEQKQTQLSERVIETDTLTKSIADTTADIRNGLSQTQENLAVLHAHAQARQDIESRTAESISRLEGIIAGTQTKGKAGENIIELVFSQLPVDWQVRNFPVGNKIVEFGLRLPNHLVLPIDSKWTATNLLEQFLASDSINEQLELKSQIEKAVINKAKEVKKYIDPSMTVDFGIAAIPDAIYDLCSGVHVDAFNMNVVLVSYSMFVPYLLLVFQMILKTSQDFDLQRLISYLDNAQSNIVELQNELEGRLSRAITMLSNSRDDIRVMLSKVSSGLTSLQIGTSSLPESSQLVEKIGDPVR